MIYVDSSVVVALLLPEARSGAVLDWYARARLSLAASVWCLVEFASALGIKQRTRQVDSAQAQAAWHRFERFVASDLALLPASAEAFHRAASLALEASNNVRAGDALHLASAEVSGARRIATLDASQARLAKLLRIEPVDFA